MACKDLSVDTINSKVETGSTLYNSFNIYTVTITILMRSIIFTEVHQKPVRKKSRLKNAPFLLHVFNVFQQANISFK